MGNLFAQVGTSDSNDMGGRALGIFCIPRTETLSVFSFMPVAKAFPAPTILSERVGLTWSDI